ncbi:unnamed protein product [Musa acuminata subsp. burmannicoides]
MDLRTLSFLLPLFLTSTTAFTPNTSYFLSCGSAHRHTIATDTPSRDFVPDSPFLSESAKSSSVTNTSAAPSSPLYFTARIFTGSASYRLTINSSGTHILRLHFLPFSNRRYDLSAARFDVIALKRFVLLDDFSAPTSTVPTIKEYFLWVDSGEFDVTFVPSSSSPLAFVNAIEVFTAPAYLIKDEDTLKVIGQVTHQALETVHRINVGGPKVTPANDTLWRTWIPDDDSLPYKNTSQVNSTDPDRIKYKVDDTAEVAPPTVYSTARTMNIPSWMPASNPDFNFNVTWSFPVVAGYTYLVRTHFCDFIDNNSIIFVLYVGNLKTEIHSSFHTDSPSEAFYIDFDAEGPSSGMINISIGRSLDSSPSDANAILNGLEIFKVNDTFGSLDGIPNHSLNSSRTKKSGVAVAMVVLAVVGGLVLTSLLSLVLVFIRKRCRSKSLPLPLLPRYNLDLHIPLIDIKASTNGFDESLVVGSGGFGKVYKGVLADGTKVAVKRAMPGSKQGYPEFQTEILILSKIRHRHLVSLIGYCEEQSEKILVYEYMGKGPLRTYLYGSDKPCLSWKQRLEICIGAARGLHYLHASHSHTIIHRDIKSTNILLDDNYLAKVSDFGLSKLRPSCGETHVTTGVKGTFGYFDPEYFKTQKLTDKSDVYSFGVMLFEVLCARAVIDRSLSMEQVNLAEWALQWQRKGQLEKIIDHRLVGNINRNSLRKFGETAEKCVADYGVDRPTFADVLWNLEYALQLHVTELKREPHEDSGIVELLIPVAATRGVESTSLNVKQEDDMAGMGMGQSDSTESTVFSQLITGEGR